MSPATCLECGLIWPSKSKAGGQKGNTPHRLAYLCVTCSVTFAKCKDLHSHEAATGHKPPQDLGPIIAAAQAAAASRAACTASAGGPSHAPAREDDVHLGVGAGGSGGSCPVCYMEFQTHDALTDHVSSMLPCPTCMTCLSPFQTLEDHYWESDDHPKCRPCALGFESQKTWTAHKVTCPVAPLKSKNKASGKAAGKRPGSQAPPMSPAATTTTSVSSVTVSSVTTSSEGGSRSIPNHPPSAYSAVPQPARTVPATTEAPQAPFSCSKCKTQYPSEESLQKHFAESPLHPKCRTCGMGFESLGPWAAHKAGCPPAGSSTSAPAVVKPPVMTAPANNLAAKSIPEEDHHARLSSATLLAARMMLPSEDGRSAVSASERPSRTCSPGTIPRSNAFLDPSTKGTTFYTAAEQASIPKDPPSVPVNGEANNVNCFDSNGEPEAASAIAIDGRDEYEEMHWYDPAVRAQHARPGRGVLPPLLADMFHTSNHALYLVSTENHPPMVSPSLPHTPTADEVHDAIPHPNASFCPEHNGWVLLQWSASAVLPPLAREPKTPLPNQNRRERTRSCVSDDGQRFGQANLTHHWHRYEKVVDAAQLNPPYTHGELLLDLYLCCQCSMTCLFSDVIPGVIPRSLMDEFTLDKVGHLAVDKATAVVAWETVLTIIDNRLWRDEKRSLPVARPKFREKIGWNSRAERVFEVLGFRLEDALKGDGKVQEQMLRPPPIDPATAEGRASRAKLLRAWVELSAWLAIYEKANKEALKHHTPLALRVQAHSERELCEMGIGAHMISQTSRGVLPEHDISEMQLEPSWEALGMTPRMHSWELLEFAYLAQCRCDPANTIVYFTHLVAIVDGMVDVGVSVPDRLWSFIENEKQERRRFTMEEHAGYARILGFGCDNHLGVELDSDVEDDFVAQAWRRARRRTWLTAGDQAEKRAQLDDALRAVAQQRSSIALVKIWNEERGSGMSRDTAYQMLGVPREADETMLLTAYSSRIEDRPDQSERMREALNVIAETTDSERLRQFLATGHDPVTMNAGPDMSRGSREQYSHSSSRSGSPSSTATESSGQLAGKELPVEDVRPLATTTTSSSKVLSYHCRSCLRDPCTNPVATVCGHIFCHSCIVRSLATRGCCPVCQKSFLIRLHVEVEVDRF